MRNKTAPTRDTEMLRNVKLPKLTPLIRIIHSNWHSATFCHIDLKEKDSNFSVKCFVEGHYRYIWNYFYFFTSTSPFISAILVSPLTAIYIYLSGSRGFPENIKPKRR